MPSCCVVGCNNWTDHPPETSFHRFPKDDAVANKWTVAIKRDNLPEKYRETSFVCSQHFRKEDYMKDLRSQLLGTPSKKTLLEDAVPSIFPHSLESLNPKRKPNKYQQLKESRDVRLSGFVFNLPMEIKHFEM